MKLVVNRCYGGFGLSLEAKLLYLKKAGYEDAQVYRIRWLRWHQSVQRVDYENQ